jgi:hypothetical protein
MLIRGKTFTLQTPAHPLRSHILSGLNAPLTIAAGVAVLAVIAVAFVVFAPADSAQDAGAGMITAAAVSRAGAVLLPSDAGAPQDNRGGN